MTDGQANGGAARITVFDLDRTLTRRGSHTPFILFCLKARPWRFYWVPLVLLFALGYGLGLVGRTAMKNLMLRAVLGGAPRGSALELGERFAEKWREEQMRPAMLDRLEHHLQQGDRVILATASFELYAKPLGHALGIDEILATPVEIGRGGKLTGRILGENCFGEEKLRRTLEVLPPERKSCYLTVYSDDGSDRTLLESADRAYVVVPKPRFRAEAVAAGLEIIEDE